MPTLQAILEHPILTPRLLPSLLLAALCLMAWPSDVHAQYQWRDAQGRLNWSDRPPPSSVQPRDILSQPAPPPATRNTVVAATSSSDAAKPAATPAKPEASLKEREMEAARKKAEQDTKDQRKAQEDQQAAAQKENCVRARANVAGLESGGRVSRFNEKGEREYLDDAQRASEMARSREIATSSCK